MPHDVRYFTSMLDAVHVAVIVTDGEGHVDYWNRHAEQLYGWRAEEVVGRMITDVLMPEPMREVGKAAIARARSHADEVVAELMLVRRDGTMFPAEVHSTPILDGDGRTAGIIGVSFDASDKKRAEAERLAVEYALRESQRHLLEAQRLAHVGSAVRDLKTNDVRLSEESRRIFFGHDDGPETVDFGVISQMIHPDDRARLTVAREKGLVTGVIEDSEYRIERPDGSQRTIHSRSRIEYDERGAPLRVHGVNLDITDQKRVELQLQQRVRQQAAVAQLGIRALGGASLQAVFDEALALVVRNLDTDFANVLERLPDQPTVRLRAGAGPWAKGSVGHAHVSAEPGSMCHFVMNTEAPVVVRRTSEETRFSPCPVLAGHGITSGISVPIHGRVHVFGVLGAHTRSERGFEAEDLDFLRSIASLLAVTIERMAVQDELREKREQLQALSHRLLEAQEAERRALALELHDDLGQFLTAIRLNVGANAGPDGKLQESLALVDEAIERVRGLALELRPSILDDLGLVAALRWLLHRQMRAAGFAGRLIADESLVAPPFIATCCFRVAQEALTNITRHALAKSVEVEVRREADDRIVIAVSDDGVGFDVAAARESASHGAMRLGLMSMEERVRLAGGTLSIVSSASGTSVRAHLPMGEVH